MCWVLNLADASENLDRWCLPLYEFEFDVVHRAGLKHQAGNAFSRLLANVHDTTKLIDAFPDLTVVAAEKANDLKCDYKERHIIDEVRHRTELILSAVLEIATGWTSPTEPITAELLAEKVKDAL